MNVKLKIHVNGQTIEVNSEHVSIMWENRPLALIISDREIEAKIIDMDTMMPIDATTMDLPDFAEAMALEVSEDDEMALGEDQDDDGEQDEEEEETYSEKPDACQNPQCPTTGSKSLKYCLADDETGKNVHGWLCTKCNMHHVHAEIQKE